MKGQNLSNTQINNNSGMLSIQNAMLRVGRGKRKCSIKISKHNKKFLIKFVEEIQKQMLKEEDPKMKNVTNFFNYLKTECSKKKLPELKLSFDELEFLKKILIDSIRGMDGLTYKWYQIIKKLGLSMMTKSSRNLLDELK